MSNGCGTKSPDPLWGEPSDGDYARAKSCAYWYLDRKMYTRFELAKKLQERGYAPELAHRVIDELEQAGYMGDAEYAERYAKDAMRFKKHGIRRIRRDLLQKGVGRDVIDAVLESLDVDTDSFLADLVAAKANGMDLSDPKQKNRLVGFLVRRGYGYDEIFSAIGEYSRNEGDF